MFVSYYRKPCCGEKKKVFESWKEVAVCFDHKKLFKLVILAWEDARTLRAKNVCFLAPKKCWTLQIVFDMYALEGN